jgi:cytidine deaminase
MKKQEIILSYTIHETTDSLSSLDADLIKDARKATEVAYAPYSHFHVGATALLKNGKKLSGTNQENASFPVGICAERVLLSMIGQLFPGEAIETMAISYHDFNNTISDKPISPCGMCRQAIHEYENRTQHPIRLLLTGMEGEIFEIADAESLLPLSFKGETLKKEKDQ